MDEIGIIECGSCTVEPALHGFRVEHPRKVSRFLHETAANEAGGRGAAAQNRAVFLQALDNALMPRRCVFCGTRTHRGEGVICKGCDDDLPYAESQPRATGSALDLIVAPLAYEFPVDAAIRAFKFHRRLEYGPAFAQLLCAASDGLPGGIDAVVPVPLHWRRRWRRGFDQALEIAAPVAGHLGVPIFGRVRRRRATRPQSGLSAAARANNLRNAFAVRGILPYRHVLIIDDVITTGATAGGLARVLKRAGAERVGCLAVASA